MSDQEHTEGEFYYPEETDEGNNQNPINMNDEEHSESQFYYPEETDERNNQNPNKDLGIDGEESQPNSIQEGIVRFVNAQKSHNTTKKTTSDLNTFRRYSESIKRGNEKIESLPVTELDHLVMQVVFRGQESIQRSIRRHLT